MKQRSVWVLLAASFAVLADVFFTLSATRLAGDAAGISLAVTAAVASALSAFGFFLQWRKKRHSQETAAPSK